MKIFVFVILVFVPLVFTHAAPQPAVVEISQPQNYTRVVAISDVHGAFKRLSELLIANHIMSKDERWAAGKTLFIVVGDSIDKGHNSIGVLDLWMKLKPQAEAAGGRIIHILGNHETEFLADPENRKARELIDEAEEKNIKLKELYQATFPRGKFLHDMPLAVKVGKWLFCHSGHYPAVDWATFKKKAEEVLSNEQYDDKFLLSSESILQDHDWWKNLWERAAIRDLIRKNDIFGIVFGHDPNAFREPGEIAAKDGFAFIKIDAGMNREAGGLPGKLLIFPQPSQMNEMVAPTALSMDEKGQAYKVK